MTHKSRLWKSPNLVTAFEEYKTGLPVFEFPELAEEAGTRHVHDLVVEARALLKRRGEMIHVFSDQTTAYVGGANRLIGASVVYNQAEDTHKFTRLYDTRSRVEDALGKMELDAIVIDYEDPTNIDPEFHRPPLTLEQAMTADASNWDFSRYTDVFFHDAYLARESSLLLAWANGVSVEGGPADFQVADYMTLGHLIEYDRLGGH